MSTFWQVKNLYKGPDGVLQAHEPRFNTAGVLRRIQPDAKLLLMLRDPVTRSQLTRVHLETLSILTQRFLLFRNIIVFVSKYYCLCFEPSFAGCIQIIFSSRRSSFA